MTQRTGWVLPWVLPCLLCVASAVQAHVASTGFLHIDARRATLSGALELSIRDAEIAVGLDANQDGRVSWGEVRAAQPAIAQYLDSHLRLSGSGAITGASPGADVPCALRSGNVLINERVDGNYLWVPFTADCPAGLSALRIDYRVLDEEDPSHRGLLTLVSAAATQTAVLGGAGGAGGVGAAQRFDLVSASGWKGFTQYVRAGVTHIWGGVDHLLFLVSLLLPAVLQRRGGRWRPVPMAVPATWNILKVVTAFTLAHSITLSLAALDVVHLPSRLTESFIAASIIVGALNNVFPLVTDARWRIAFAFGLLHGFGFASVLSEMGLPHGSRLSSLLGFNLGVEAGQLAVVVALMPLAYLLRATRFYQRGVLPWGSTAIAGLALVWFVQRAFG